MKCTTKGKRKREKKLDCADAGADDGYERMFCRSGGKLPGRDDQRKPGGTDGRGGCTHLNGGTDGIPDAEIHSRQWEDSDSHAVTGSDRNAGSDDHAGSGSDGNAGSDSRTSSDRSAGSDTHAETDFDRGPDGIPDT